MPKIKLTNPDAKTIKVVYGNNKGDVYDFFDVKVSQLPNLGDRLVFKTHSIVIYRVNSTAVGCVAYGEYSTQRR